ncbi:hypothetical protein [Streptomyces sp. NPDC101206]
MSDGWQAGASDDLRRDRRSPDGAHVLGYKRDSYRGTAAETAADGRLDW